MQPVTKPRRPWIILRLARRGAFYLTQIVPILRLSLLHRLTATAPEVRTYYHARLLRHAATTLQRLIRATGFHQAFIIDASRISVEAGTVRLNIAKTDRYLIRSRTLPPNEGTEALQFLAQHGLAVRTVVDLGANFGEIAIACAVAGARVLAVEPSTDNLAILRDNLAANGVPEGQIVVVSKAIAATRGNVGLSVGRGGENSILHVRGETETVPSLSLTDLLAEYPAFASPDFIKIDLEGAEGYLTASILALGGQVPAFLIELRHESADLIDVLPGYRIFARDGSPLTPGDVRQRLERDGDGDFYFLRR